jgi:hypothetical protein
MNIHVCAIAGLVLALPDGDEPKVGGPLPYEVNTHQWLGVRAAQRSVNLRHFVDDFAFSGLRYSDRFPRQAQDLSDLIRVGGRGPVDLIGAGCVLEDSGNPLTGRFHNHFFDPTNGSGLGNGIASPEWGFDGGGATNDFSWQRLLDYHLLAVAGPTPAIRTQNQELLFVGLGHVTHLVQDACQPAHTRDDPHPVVHVLETYGAENVFLGSGSLPESLEDLVQQQAQIYRPEFPGFFTAAAEFSNLRFFSDDTIFRDYPEPSTTTTSLRLDTIASSVEQFVVSNFVLDPRNGSQQRLARVHRGLFGTSRSLSAPLDVVAIDNVEALLPVAVALSEGLIDHFLRGRLQLALDPQTSRVRVRNISDLAAVGAPGDVQFRSGEFRLHYETVDGGMRELPAPLSPQPLAQVLSLDQTLLLPGDVLAFLATKLDPGLPPDQRARADQRMVVTFDGQIGSERGTCAARLNLQNRVSLLLSFDTSGSIGSSQMANVRAAGQTLLPLLQRGQQNRIAVHRFASGASVALDWTTDIGAANAVIGGPTRPGPRRCTTRSCWPAPARAAKRPALRRPTSPRKSS